MRGYVRYTHLPLKRFECLHIARLVKCCYAESDGKETKLELNNIELTVTDADLAAIVDKYAPGDDAPVGDLAARIDSDGVTISGKLQAGVLKGSFEAGVALRAEGRIVVMGIARVKALGPVGNMFKGMLMSTLQKKLGDTPGVSSDADTIRIDPQRLLASRGVGLTLDTLAITFAPGRLTAKLAGSLDCDVTCRGGDA